MSFYLTGLKPTNVIGEVFENSIWWWHPLWNYIIDNCREFLSEEQIIGGQFNEFCKITETQAKQISNRLEQLIKIGHTKNYEIKHKQELIDLGDICSSCNGGEGRCRFGMIRNGCLIPFFNSIKQNMGIKGNLAVPFCESPFSVENVKVFALFCKHSGGFSIG